MLRLIALALLLANVLFFFWDHELLRDFGFGPTLQSEPQRMAQQINPDSVKLLKPAEFNAIQEQVKADQAPTECLQAGPFDTFQSLALRQTLGQVLPPDSWALQEMEVTARWIVYMGKYAGAEVLAKKRAEVAAMNLKPENLDSPGLEPGFSLGTFESKADADAALARLVLRGLHTARVVQSRTQGLSYLLMLPKVGATLKPKLAELRGPLGGKALRACN